MNNSVRILGVEIENLSTRETIERIERLIGLPKAKSIFIVNAHSLNIAYKDSYYKRVLNSADLVLNDGTGIGWAAKRCNVIFKDNLVGTDLIPRLCDDSRERRYSFYLLGGREGVAEQAALNLQTTYPGLQIAGCHVGYFNHQKSQEVIEKINQKSPDILLVAFGNPLQEKWIHENLNDLGIGICIGVGGLFDHLSGRLKRAPLWIRKMGLEWTFILLLQPHKWKRYLIGNPLFILRVNKYSEN